jgi:hypothetical protein
MIAAAAGAAVVAGVGMVAASRRTPAVATPAPSADAPDQTPEV